jgi:hypothetical protein
MRELNRDFEWSVWWSRNSKVPRLVIGVHLYRKEELSRDFVAKEVISRGRTKEHFVRLIVDAADLLPPDELAAYRPAAPDEYGKGRMTVAIGDELALADRMREVANQLVLEGIRRAATKFKFTTPPESLPYLPHPGMPPWTPPHR